MSHGSTSIEKEGSKPAPVPQLLDKITGWAVIAFVAFIAWAFWSNNWGPGSYGSEKFQILTVYVPGDHPDEGYFAPRLGFPQTLLLSTRTGEVRAVPGVIGPKGHGVFISPKLYGRSVQVGQADWVPDAAK